MNDTKWTECKVCGYIVACDPGINNFSSYPKSFSRKELKIGMNLCAHEEHLPKVIVKKIADDHIVVRYFGKSYQLDIGQTLYTPRQGLSYAYSEAVITLISEE